MTTRNDPKFHNDLKKNFNDNLSIINFAVLLTNNDGILIDYNKNPGKPHELNYISGNLLDKLHPDQFKIMTHKHYIAIHEEPPRVTLVNGKPRTKYNYLLKYITTLENSKYSFLVLSGSMKQLSAKIKEFYEKRRFEMIISLFLAINTAAPKLMTYEESVFCLLVPNPELKSLGEEIFFLV